MLQRGHSGDGCDLALDVCIWRMFVFMYVVTVWGNVCCVAAVVKNSFFLALEC